MIEHTVRYDYIERLVGVGKVCDIAYSKIDLEILTLCPVAGPGDRVFRNINSSSPETFASEIDRMTSIAAAEIQNRIHFFLDVELIVRETLAYQTRAKANDILVRIPHGHELLAVNFVPLLVYVCRLFSHRSPKLPCGKFNS